MNQVRQMAEAHVDWLLKTIRPLLIEQFVHGYKHGFEHGRQLGKRC
jgi:hypothetical protein